MIKIIVCGIGGKVGKTLIGLTAQHSDLQLVGGVDKFADANEYEIPIFKNFSECNIDCDVVIDFSRPDATADIVNYCTSHSANLVIATTGQNDAEQAMIDAASQKIAVFQSSNMSLGVNLLIGLAAQAAKFLGNSYDIEILEYHHNLKVDSPSGTALSLAKGINQVFDNKKEFVYGRHSSCDKRTSNEIGIHAIRGGTIVGRHEVMYIGTDEIVTLKHEAESRQVFANGAIRAAQFISDKKSGKYNMNDILGNDYAVTMISMVKDVSLFTLQNIDFIKFTELLNAIAKGKINLDMISQTNNSDNTINISFTCCDTNCDFIKDVIKELSLPYTFLSGAGKLVIEGAGMEHKYGVANEVLHLLNSYNTNIYSITTSETTIACCIDGDQLKPSHDMLMKYYNIIK